MLTPLLLLALANPAPTGFTAKTPLDEVKALDAQLLDTLHASPALDALLASPDELKAMLAKMGIAGPDAEVVLATAIQERVPAADLPQSFAATTALVATGAKPGTPHNVRFYDAKGYRLDFDVVGKKAKGVWALTGAPRGQDSDVADDLEVLHAGHADEGKPLPLYFTKTDKGWVAAALPAPDAARCRDKMHEKAKAIVDAQNAARAKLGKFPGGEALSHFGEGFVGWTRIEPVDDAHWRAEVNRHGGKVTVDETGTITDVSPCALTPGKQKPKQNPKEKK